MQGIMKFIHIIMMKPIVSLPCANNKAITILINANKMGAINFFINSIMIYPFDFIVFFESKLKLKHLPF